MFSKEVCENIESSNSLKSSRHVNEINHSKARQSAIHLNIVFTLQRLIGEGYLHDYNYAKLYTPKQSQSVANLLDIVTFIVASLKSDIKESAARGGILHATQGYSLRLTGVL